jgi:hypothetical protein
MKGSEEISGGIEILKLGSAIDQNTGKYIEYTSSDLYLDKINQQVVFKAGSQKQYFVFIVYGKDLGFSSLELGVKYQATSCGFSRSSDIMSLNYIIGKSQGSAINEDFKISTYLKPKFDECEISSAKFKGSGFESITYDLKNEIINVDKTIGMPGLFNGYLEVSIASG